MSTDVKRSQFRTFMDVTPTTTADYQLVGDGVTSGKVSMNPAVSNETYVHEDVATISVDSYAPTYPIEAKCKVGDAVFAFVDNLHRTFAVGADAQTTIVNVFTYETPVAGAYPAVKHDVSVQVDEFGGDGGAVNVINYTINYRGTPVPGMFDPTTRTFTPDA